MDRYDPCRGGRRRGGGHSLRGLPATALRPLAVRAEPAAMPGIGFLNGAVAHNYAPLVAAFLDGLREAGFVEGRNERIEYRWAEGTTSGLPRSQPISFSIRSPSSPRPRRRRRSRQRLPPPPSPSCSRPRPTR